MKCKNVTKYTYISYSKESTTFLKCTYNAELWAYIWIHIQELYDATGAKKPVHLNYDVTEMKKKLKDYINNHVEFTCELPSVTGKCNPNYIPETINNPFICARRLQQRIGYDELQVCQDIGECCVKAKQLTNRSHELERKKAAEILTFL